MTYEPVYTSDRSTPEAVLRQIDGAESNLPGLIFNSPPIPLWQPPVEDGLSAARIWDRSSVYSNNLYLHIPFYRQKCSFCYYSVVPGAQDDYIDSYMDCLEKEAQLYAEAAFEGSAMDTVFVGGGTPSLLSERQIIRLFEKIVARFDLSKVREITFECAPDSITPEKLEILKARGEKSCTQEIRSQESSSG